MHIYGWREKKITETLPPHYYLLPLPLNQKTYLHRYLNILGAENKNDNKYAALTEEKRSGLPYLM
jgi:hypothetical protein